MKLQAIPERLDPDSKNASKAEKTLHIERYRYAAKIIQQHTMITDKTVLDIACGYGYGSFLIYTVTGLDVVGLDVDTHTIKFSKEKYRHYKHIVFKKGNIASISYRENSFDFAVCLETLEHLTPEKSRQAVKELYRVLKPGGILIASGPNPFFTKVMKRVIPSYHNPYHLNELSSHDLVDLFVKQRFNIIRVSGQYPFFPVLYLLNLLLQPMDFLPPALCRYYIIVARKAK